MLLTRVLKLTAPTVVNFNIVYFILYGTYAKLTGKGFYH